MSLCSRLPWLSANQYNLVIFWLDMPTTVYRPQPNGCLTRFNVVLNGLFRQHKLLSSHGELWLCFIAIRVPAMRQMRGPLPTSSEERQCRLNWIYRMTTSVQMLIKCQQLMHSHTFHPGKVRHKPQSGREDRHEMRSEVKNTPSW